MDHRRSRVASRVTADMTPSVVYVVPDKMGGMISIVESLLAHRHADGFRHEVVLTDNQLSEDARFGGRLPADAQRTVHYRLPTENMFAVVRRLRDAIPPGGGVLVSNDQIELAMLHRFDPGRMVVQLLHGDHDYYYDLADRHQAVIDAWIAYSRSMADGLRRRLPHRAADVHYLPYGIDLPPRGREHRPGPIRLVFAGRLEHGQKGVFDLPLIDERLRERGVTVQWTVMGDGPDRDQLRRRWASARVAWSGPLARREVLARLADGDLFILPTRAEGLPVALIEAMGAGLVPIVSDIASGVPELVEHNVSGLRIAVGDVPGFAAAIADLAGDPARLETMSAAARRAIGARFDPRARTAEYQALFARWQALRRPRPARLPIPYRTRLDQPWLPNPVVRTVRTAIRRYRGKPA
jgi:glycosyltransferase involved in cell wall biosynthesis